MSTPPPPAAPASGSSDESLAAMERLRNRVEAAVAEIERLRTENAKLAERVDKLASHEVVGETVPGLKVEGDPDALREQVEGFIEAIDRMLAVPSSDEETSSESTA
jgi:regulator of replication initiation timing